MVLASLVFSDATGGGVGAAPAGCPALVVPGDAGHDSYLVGYALDGISVNEVTLTIVGDARWPTGGMSLRPTSDGTAVGAGRHAKWLPHKVPAKAGQTITPTITSGAHYAFGILYFDVEPYSLTSMPGTPGNEAMFWSRTTAASGANLTANTFQSGLVTLRDFGDFQYEVDSVHAAAAFTTNPIIGLKVSRSDWPYWVHFILPLTDVAQDWHELEIPEGVLKITQGQTLEVGWVGETAEQPTGTIRFRYSVPR